MISRRLTTCKPLFAVMLIVGRGSCERSVFSSPVIALEKQSCWKSSPLQRQHRVPAVTDGAPAEAGLGLRHRWRWDLPPPLAAWARSWICCLFFSETSLCRTRPLSGHLATSFPEQGQEAGRMGTALTVTAAGRLKATPHMSPKNPPPTTFALNTTSWN